MSLPFSVSRPELLIVGVVLFAITIGLSIAARHHLSKGRRRASLLIRSVMLASLVLALSGLALVWPVDRLTTVYVVDLSDSVGNAGRDYRVSLRHARQRQDALVEVEPGELAVDVERRVREVGDRSRLGCRRHRAPIVDVAPPRA